jgi:hypothetical protein
MEGEGCDIIKALTNTSIKCSCLGMGIILRVLNIINVNKYMEMIRILVGINIYNCQCLYMEII